MSAALSLALLSVAFAPDAQPAPVGGEFASAVDRAAALPPEEALSCHARDHFELSGDAACVWGRGFRVEDAGACVKLQCSRTRHGVSVGEHAHRALDDCLALRGVCQALADRHGVSVARLFMPFCVALDKDSTLLQLSCAL